MKPLEKNLERRVKHWLRQRKIRFVKMNLQGNRSYPDLMIFIPGGTPLLLELKRSGKVPSRLQQRTLTALRKLGYNVSWADGFDEVVAWLIDEIQKATLRSA